MIRHIYGLRYDQVSDDAVPESALPIRMDDEKNASSIELMFHIGVFNVADRYPVFAL